MDNKTRRDAVLSEARVLIAEGEWGRGSYKRKVKINHDQQVLLREGVTYTRSLDCYCVAGAVYEAVDNLAAEAERAGERSLWMGARLDAFDQLAQTARMLDIAPRAPRVCRESITTVIQTNDRMLENKGQALRWLDAAVADKTLSLS